MAPSPRALRLKLQTKVLVPVMACLVILPSVIGWIVDRHITEQALHEARQTLASAATVFRNLHEMRLRDLASRFGNTVNEPRFKAVAQLGDPPTMTAFLRDLLDESSFETEVMLFGTAEGATLAGARRDPAIGLDAFAQAAAELIASAGAGHPEAGMVALGPRVFHVVAVPVFLKDRSALVGTLAVGIRFNDASSQELKLLTRTEILVLAGGDLAAGTINSADVDPAALLVTSDRAAGGVRQVIIDGEHFLALQGEFGDREALPGIPYILLSSYEGRLRALGATRRTLAGVSALVIASGLLVVWLAVRKVTRPLRQLRDGAEAVGRGDFTRRIDVAANDECGALADSFNRMTARLQASRDQLEATVARLESAREQLIERERRLRESEEGLRLIVDGVQDHAIVTLDAAGRVTRWNAAAERLLGYPAAEAHGLAYAVFFKSDDRAAGLPEETLAATRRKGRHGFEGWRVRRDGSRFWADVTLSPLPDADGAAGGFVEIARDITVRKEAEEALRSARDAAEAASRAKSEFLANMSHEIRTPMNAIIGMTSLLLDENLPSDQREYAETIRASSHALLEIFDEILDISKLEAARAELQAQPFAVAECLDQVLGMFAARCAQKRLEIVALAAAELPAFVVVDGARLRQVLANLVGNAVKFTERGGVAITAGPAPDRGVDFLRFTVEDTGIGIPADRLHRLFQPFSQVDASSTRRHGGVGLGLAIAQRLVGLMDGSIEVESIRSRGTLFRFTVRAPAWAGSDPSPSGARAFAPLPQPRVALVSASAHTGGALKRQLAWWRAAVVDAPSIEAIPDTGPFDIVLLDRPDPEAPAQLRSRFDPKPPPVVALGDAGTAWDGIRAEWIGTPARLRELHAVLHRLAAAAAPKPAPVAAPPVAAEGTFASRHPMRLLVVDDNAVNVRVIQLVLRKLGYDSDAAQNGLEALACLSRQAYDAVFMDMQMPEMDGLEATRRLRRSVPVSAPPYVMALTANARDEDRDACFAAGMHDFVSKPARLDKISDALERAHAWLLQRTATATTADAG